MLFVNPATVYSGPRASSTSPLKIVFHISIALSTEMNIKIIFIAKTHEIEFPVAILMCEKQN